MQGAGSVVYHMLALFVFCHAFRSPAPHRLAGGTSPIDASILPVRIPHLWTGSTLGCVRTFKRSTTYLELTSPCSRTSRDGSKVAAAF